MLSARITLRDKPWLLVGDLNEIIDNTEKSGGPARVEGTFCDFRSFMSECDLYDLNHIGNLLSWRGERHTHIVFCRLDREIANSLWAEDHPTSFFEYLNFEGLDHRPIMVRLNVTKREKEGFSGMIVS